MKSFLQQEKPFLFALGILLVPLAFGEEPIRRLALMVFLILVVGALFDYFFTRYGKQSAGKKFSLLFLFLISLIPRLLVLDFESGDYTGNLSLWYDTLKNEGFASLSRGFHNYSPPYLYLMYLVSLLPLKKIWAIKLIALVFDYLLAWGVVKLTETTGNRRLAYQAGFVSLLLPTVWMNSALWGQCDSIHTSLLLFALYGFIREKKHFPWIMLGLAFAFKIQTIFIVLVPALLYLKGKFPLSRILWIPAIYLLAVFPNYLAGRPLYELLTIYLDQAGAHEGLSSFAPNVYQWLSWAPGTLFTRLGIIGTGVLCAAFCFYVWKSKWVPDSKMLLRVALFSCLLIPFFLPRMHDRYFYPADVLSLIYAFTFPKRWYLPLLVVGASFFAYLYFLFATLVVFPFSVLAAMMALALIICGRDLYLSIEEQNHDLHPEERHP